MFVAQFTVSLLLHFWLQEQWLLLHGEWHSLNPWDYMQCHVDVPSLAIVIMT